MNKKIKIKYSWTEFGKDIDNACKKLSSFKISNLYPLDKNSELIAQILSRKLKIKVEKKIKNNTLIVSAIDMPRRYVYRLCFSLFINDESPIISDMFIRVKNKEEEIIFPWL